MPGYGCVGGGPEATARSHGSTTHSPRRGLWGFMGGVLASLGEADGQEDHHEGGQDGDLGQVRNGPDREDSRGQRGGDARDPGDALWGSVRSVSGNHPGRIPSWHKHCRARAGRLLDHVYAEVPGECPAKLIQMELESPVQLNDDGIRRGS